MSTDFHYDAFLSHSSKDTIVVRDIAKRLRSDGVRVWFSEWALHAGSDITVDVAKGLEQSRVLVLCVSAHAAPEWPQMEAATLRFRDPANSDRHLIPLRLDEAPMKGSLAHFVSISWLGPEREQQYRKLLEICRTRENTPARKTRDAQSPDLTIQLPRQGHILSYAFTPDGQRVLSGDDQDTMHLWDISKGALVRAFEGHTDSVWSVAWSADQRNALSSSSDGTIRLWDVETGTCLRVFSGHANRVSTVAWSSSQHRALSAGFDHTVRLWDIASGQCIRVLEGHTNRVLAATWSSDDRLALSCSEDKSLRLWEVETGRCLRVFEGHTGDVWSVAWSSDQRRALSASEDRTVRLWNLDTGKCDRVFEGHTGPLWTAAWSVDDRYVLSACYMQDPVVRVWDVASGRCVRTLDGVSNAARFVVWSRQNDGIVVAGDGQGGVHYWGVSDLADNRPSRERAATSSKAVDVRYTNAKVLLVGESGAGKTGLSHRLASNAWQPSDSTVGAWATQWKLPVSSVDHVEREIWLWDFGGQADQRLIHQLYMAETALAVLVFDGQKEDLFETLGQWDRDLTRAAGKDIAKILVAARVDAGGLRVSRSQIDEFVRERGYYGFYETSAKTNAGCGELRRAVLDAIRWEEIPWRSSPVLFRRLKEEIVRFKEEERVLMRFNELRDALKLRVSDETVHFTDDELSAVIGLLASPGVVWELNFGRWVLLQPERINAYAQAVIQTLRADQLERGCLPEERVLSGELAYHSSISRLPADEERFVLLAMHQTLVERGLCMREHTDRGTLLVFPSYYRRERPELEEHPSVLVTYRFQGFLDDIYATLVVRLHHTDAFTQDNLWRYGADFRTASGRQLGIKLTRRAEGSGELDVYFSATVTTDEKIIFSRYIHEHLLQNAQNVVRLRHYVCPNCATPVASREVAARRLQEGKTYILCVNCESHIPLRDTLEELFASDRMRQKVSELQRQSAAVLDNESQERTLVGDVISTVSLAGQICREKVVSDRGIDMEIEFINDRNEPSGQILFIQLKSADSYPRKRNRDGAETFTIKDKGHARYWASLPFPVMLVTRTSTGEIRWLDVRDQLRRGSEGGKRLSHIRFTGERFDVMSVRRWRDTALLDTNDSLFERETDENKRADALRRLMSRPPDENARDLFLRVLREDSSAIVRNVAYEALCQRWWREAAVRNEVRTRVGAEHGGTSKRLLRLIGEARSSLAGFWEAKPERHSAEREPETVPGYPAFRFARFRLRNIGPFEDTGEITLHSDVNVFLGDNTAGKTTILRCLALAAIGLPAANEVEDNAEAYLRKGTKRGTIECLIEIIPDPGALENELGHIRVGLQISEGSSRFAPMADRDMTLARPGGAIDFPNSAETLGALRSRRSSQFGFVAAYGAVRNFGESRFAIQSELKKRENEWVLSLFKTDTWLVNPEVFTKLLRGDTSNIEDAPAGGLAPRLSASLRESLVHLFPDVAQFFSEGDHDLQLNGVSLRFSEVSDGYRSLFALMGHLLRCSLKVRNWDEDPTRIDGIALIDEMDLHLHPAWQTHVVQDFRSAFENVQLIVSTHSPLVVAALKREHVLIMRREESERVTLSRPESDPQGLGVAGILTTIFDLGSTIDQPTLDKITRRILLHSMRDQWTDQERREYDDLTEELSRLGFNREFSDPYFERFATAMARRHRAVVETMTPKEKVELDAYADDLLASIANEGAQ